MKRCVECGSHALTQGEVTEARTVAGRTFTAQMPATICEDCKESYVDGPVLERFDLAVTRALADAGEHSGVAVRFMRASLGLTATELGTLLDVAPATISRWENDKHAVPRDVVAILAAMADDRIEGRATMLMRLRALHEPRPAGERRDLGRVTAPAA
jgi:putative zinc finger/helix-turn-helix YgiT family protein